MCYKYLHLLYYIHLLIINHGNIHIVYRKCSYNINPTSASNFHNICRIEGKRERKKLYKCVEHDFVCTLSYFLHNISFCFAADSSSHNLEFTRFLPNMTLSMEKIASNIKQTRRYNTIHPTLLLLNI